MVMALFDENGRPIKVVGNETTELFDEYGRPVIVIASGGDPLKLTDLDDTPESYEGNAGKVLQVDTGENALEFAEAVKAKAGGKNLWVQAAEPTAIATGDLWVEIE